MGKKILVIEDNLMNMELLSDWLEAHDFEVLQAYGALEGIELAQTLAPDLVLMDIALPGMDGVEATRVLKKDASTAHIPIIAVTASSMRVNLETLAEVGCENVVFKPIDFEELSTKMNEVLEA